MVGGNVAAAREGAVVGVASIITRVLTSSSSCGDVAVITQFAVLRLLSHKFTRGSRN